MKDENVAFIVESSPLTEGETIKSALRGSSVSTILHLKIINVLKLIGALRVPPWNTTRLSISPTS